VFRNIPKPGKPEAKSSCLWNISLPGKFQIPSTPPERRRASKFQLNHKFQYSIRGASACAARDQNRNNWGHLDLSSLACSFFQYLIAVWSAAGGLVIVICLLFVICYLRFMQKEKKRFKTLNAVTLYSKSLSLGPAGFGS
jgi:hypothetical protein